MAGHRKGRRGRIRPVSILDFEDADLDREEVESEGSEDEGVVPLDEAFRRHIGQAAGDVVDHHDPADKIVWRERSR